MGGSIQPNYTKLPKGFKGGIANSNPVRRNAEACAMAIDVGTFVKLGATGITDLTAITDVVNGLVLKSSAIEPETLAIGAGATVGRGGSFFVYCETACAKGADVFVRCVVGAGAEPVGNVRDDIDVDKAQVIKAVFAETLLSAGLVEIELNI